MTLGPLVQTSVSSGNGGCALKSEAVVHEKESCARIGVGISADEMNKHSSLVGNCVVLRRTVKMLV